MTREDIECIIKWFSHIEQLATDGKTANGFQMPPDKILTTIKVVAKDSREYVEKFCNESISNDLEEAAGLWYEKCPFPKSTWWNEGEEMKLTDSRETFIAGAKWQKEQDEKEQADLFTIVALDAAQRAKEQMMENALHGWLDEDNEPPYDLNVVCEEKIPFGKFKHGDKVRIIVIKED